MLFSRVLTHGLVALMVLLGLSGLGLLWHTHSKHQAEFDTPPGTPARFLRLGHNLHTDSALHLAAARFAAQLEEHSRGRLRVEVFPNQALGSDAEMVDMARSGELDLVLTPTAKLSGLTPSMQYVDLPFYFPDRATLYRMLDGEPGAMLLERLKPHGLVGVAFWENGFKHFTAKRPLLSPDDFSQLNMRVMQSPMLMEQMRALGAQPVVTDFHAIYQAIQDGSVDGQENPLVAIAGLKLAQVQPHLTLSAHAYLGYVFSVSAQTLNRLPMDLQTLVLSTARSLTEFERTESQRREAMFLKQIQDAGATVHRLSPAQRQVFAQRLAHLPEQFELEIGTDILSKTEELMAQTRPDEGQVKPLLLGLDTDLSGAAAQSGVAIKRGIKLALEEINQNGGLLGRPLELLALDHKGIPSMGVKNLEYLSQFDNLVAVLGGLHSGVVTAELDTIHALRLPFLVPWAAAVGLTDNGRQPNYVFRLSLDDAHVGAFLVDYAARRHQRPALLLENSVWGRGNLTTMRRALSIRGLTPAAVEWLNLGDTPEAYQAKFEHFRQEGADTLILVANFVESVNVVNALAQDEQPLPVVAHWGFTGGNFWSAASDSLRRVELVFPQTIFFHADNTPKVRALRDKYLQRYHVKHPGEIVSPVGTAHAYDLVHLLARAVEQAGSIDHAAVREALENLEDYHGLVQDYTPPFTPQNHDALPPERYRMARYADNGWIVPVE